MFVCYVLIVLYYFFCVYSWVCLFLGIVDLTLVFEVGYLTCFIVGYCFVD